MRIDLHVHSSFSDGTDNPTELVFKAQAARLDVIALCDHDTFDGISYAQEAGKRVGVTVLPGLEMSTVYSGASVHLLGYGCDPYSPELLLELKKIRAERERRIPAMAEKLTAAGFEVTEEQIRAQAGRARSLGRPHVADAMVELGYVQSRQEAFDNYIGYGCVGYVPRYATELGDAIDLIHQAHGVAVIAHPWGHGSERVMSADVITAMAKDHGLEGIEVDHQDHDPQQRALLFQLGERLGLVRTGSSDYHGLGKFNHELGCNLTRPSAYQDLVHKIKLRGGKL